MSVRHLILPLAALALPALAQAAAKPKWVTPGEILAKAPASDWREIPASDLLLLDFAGGRRVVIQLAPAFAPVHVDNIRRLAAGGWWKDAKVYRVQDNYVVQWGKNDGEGPLPAGVVAKPPAEYDRPLKGLTASPVRLADPYASYATYADGWPISVEAKTGRVSLAHCYAMVGAGRDLSPDTGVGGELYAVIGHAPRQLDRNIALVGRVIAGFEAMTALPRGTEGLGIYKDRASDVPILATRLATDLPEAERPRFEMLRTDSASFRAFAAKRANRRDDFYIRPAGGVDLCNLPVPVRPKK